MSELDDEGLVHGGVLSFILLEFFDNLFVSIFNLSECNTVDHVLNEFNTLLQSGDFYRLLVILVSPGRVFPFSLSGTILNGSNDFVVVFVGLFQVCLSLDKYSRVFGDGEF